VDEGKVSRESGLGTRESQAIQLPTLGFGLHAPTARRAATLLVAASVAATPPALLAQSSSLEGSVSTDSLGKHSMPGAEISIPALNLSTRTNFAGEYHLGGIAPGRYLAIATAAGYRSVGDSVTIEAGGPGFHDFVLARPAIVLDSVVSKAPAPRQYISPGLNGFEERRLSGKGGYFITDSIMRREEDRPLEDIIGMHVPGVIIQRVGGTHAFLASGRGPKGMSSAACYPDVYLDGVFLAPLGVPGASAKAVDLRQFPPTDLAAAEFYPGGATLPVQFNHTASGCGALALWTREK
jgi:hypothetical protein